MKDSGNGRAKEMLDEDVMRIAQTFRDVLFFFGRQNFTS